MKLMLRYRVRQVLIMAVLAVTRVFVVEARRRCVGRQTTAKMQLSEEMNSNVIDVKSKQSRSQ